MVLLFFCYCNILKTTVAAHLGQDAYKKNNHLKVYFLENKGHIIPFKCMNLVDAIIQSNIYYIEGIHFICSCCTLLILAGVAGHLIIRM